MIGGLFDDRLGRCGGRRRRAAGAAEPAARRPRPERGTRSPRPCSTWTSTACGATSAGCCARGRPTPRPCSPGSWRCARARARRCCGASARWASGTGRRRCTRCGGGCAGCATRPRWRTRCAARTRARRALWKRLQDGIGVLHDHHLLVAWFEEQARPAEARGERGGRARRAARAALLPGGGPPPPPGVPGRPVPPTSPCARCRRWRAAGRSPEMRTASSSVTRSRCPSGSAGHPGREKAPDPGGRGEVPRGGPRASPGSLDRPDALLTSPWLRARQTAAIAAAAWGGVEPKETAGPRRRHVRGAGRRPRPLSRATRRWRSSATSPISRSCLARLLGARHDRAARRFKKGGGGGRRAARRPGRGRLARARSCPRRRCASSSASGRPWLAAAGCARRNGTARPARRRGRTPPRRASPP